MTHGELIRAAAKWLRKRYAIVLEDVRTNSVREQPDVIGWKNYGPACVIECKASLPDYQRDASKSFRRNPEEGMGDHRWYAAPSKLAPIIAEAEVHRGPNIGRWGVLAIAPKGSVQVILKAKPFMEHAYVEEKRLLIYALRCATEEWGRRIFGPIAPMHPDGDPHPTASKIIRELRDENTKFRQRLRRVGLLEGTE